MVDFKKKREAKSDDNKIHPLDIYERLDRKSDKGPLRDVQKEILTKWFETFQQKKDVILKLHTGQGKTIIGLLILQSKLNQGCGPALYLCPTPYLVSQTCAQADSFGIKYCIIDGSKEIPNDFLDSKSILITSAQKLFNGYSKFGLNARSTEVGTIILDDAHSCVEVIRDAYKLKVKRVDKDNNESVIYKKLLNLFEEPLKKQQAGTLADILDGEYDALMTVPYWDWKKKADDVLQILAANKEEVKFSWELIKNILPECRCVITGYELEISPYTIPLETFGSYYKASHRVFMSATLNDDSFFVNGLGLSEDTIVNPLKLHNEKWSGEKLVLLPSQIDDTLDRSTVVKLFGTPRRRATYGIVAIVPSHPESRDWLATGSFVPASNSEQFKVDMDRFLKGSYSQTLVLVNKYDGIDLPDENCRLLIMCSVPFAGSLDERYIESCRATSEQILLKTAQGIEQGLGRGVRGEKDYCCILLVGSNLIKLVKSAKTNKFFSAQTQKQIEIGLNLSEDIENDIKHGTLPEKAFQDVIDQQIDSEKRSDEWKAYYKEEMDSIVSKPKKNNVLPSLLLERKAYLAYRNGDVEGSVKAIQEIIDSNAISEEERGWYLQEIARYYSSISVEKSNHFQNSAYKLNYNLFKPMQGHTPKKIGLDSTARNERIISYLGKFDSFFELQLDVDTLLNNLVFDSGSELFEKSMEDLGKILGYESIRPDKENNEGPDNLWKIDNNQFLVIECKNRVDPNRSYIIRDEAAKMEIYINWYKKNYSAPAKYIMIYPTQKMLDKGCYFSDDVFVLRRGMLGKLKQNILSFFKEFKNDNLQAVSNTIITQRLSLHNLADSNILNDFYEPIKEQKSSRSNTVS